VQGVARREPLDGGWVDAVDRGERHAALCRERPPGVLQGLLTQDAPRDGLSCDALHHEPAASVVQRAAPDHRGHRDADRRGGAQERSLDLHRRREARGRAPIDLQDEGPALPVCLEVEGAGGPRRAAREPVHVDGRPAERSADEGGDPIVLGSH